MQVRDRSYVKDHYSAVSAALWESRRGETYNGGGDYRNGMQKNYTQRGTA
jgi:dTDP-D-glucose 4,6-dehydratase